MAQSFFRHVVIADVVLHGGTVLLQRVAYVGSQRQTDVSVRLCLFAQHGGRHCPQASYQRVVARNVVISLVQESFERQLLALEHTILIGSLVARIGQVEHVFLLLRIKHQRVLVRSQQRFHQLVAHVLALFLIHFYHLRQFTMIVHKFCAQNLQRLRQVFLLQHSMGAESYQHDQKYRSESFHCFFFKICVQR